MAKNGFKTLNLPIDLVDELQIYRLAFIAAYGRVVSYGEMIRGMLDSLEDSDPAVIEELDRLVKQHPEYLDKLGRYRSLPGDDAQGE